VKAFHLPWVQRIGGALSGKTPPILTWCLDYPAPDRAPQFTRAGRVVQGWVLLPPKTAKALSRVRIVCHLQPTFELCCPLNAKRPDVIKTVLGQSSAGHPQSMCGFRFTVPPDLTSFQLSLELDGECWDLQRVVVEPHTPADNLLKVLPGRDGWLFLDNDTNFSVDQFAGHIRLTATGLKAWRNYAQVLTGGFAGLRAPALLLAAPTKESVMCLHHPVKAAATPMLQPVLDLLPPEQWLHPVEELQAFLGDESFLKTDTHWTHKGAALVATLVAQRLGLQARQVDQVLAADRYATRNHFGDLGSKMPTRVYAPASFLTSFHYRHWVVYDNGLPNFGRVVVIHYPEALADVTCLVFGSSSSYSMFNYLCRFFRCVVFVHSAGNLDASLVSSVGPEYVVAQTNARFMIRPPVAHYDLRSVIVEKQNSLDASALEMQAKNRHLADTELMAELGLTPWHLRVPSIDDL
jgi:hypothetical protein